MQLTLQVLSSIDSNTVTINNLEFADISTPTTLAGYGITDGFDGDEFTPTHQLYPGVFADPSK